MFVGRLKERNGFIKEAKFGRAKVEKEASQASRSFGTLTVPRHGQETTRKGKRIMSLVLHLETVLKIKKHSLCCVLDTCGYRIEPIHF